MMGTHRMVALGMAAMLSVVAARPRTRNDAVPTAGAGTPAPATRCPAGGLVVPAGAALQAVLDGSTPGTVLCLSPGRYDGPVEIHTRLTLIGPADAVLHSNGTGTTLRVLADSAEVRGFTVDGSGRRYDKMDAAVYLRGDGTQALGLTVRNALFGIVAEQSNGVTIADNHIAGLAELPVGIRGDGIRLWEVRRSSVARNRLTDSRDIVVWYSPNNRIVGNTVVGSRYATHFMYSDDCLVEGADYRGNIVGVFVMYSRGITLRADTIANNTFADGLGLGVKESGNLTVEDSHFINDRDCLYLDTSPFREGDTVLVRGNTFAGCNAAVTFHSSEQNNAFRDNTFYGNQTQVAVEGRGTAQDVVWHGNYFDDYTGYDLNGDGTGDVPYELRDFSERLVSNHPQLAFFRGSVVFAVLDATAHVFPLLQPETLLTDPAPRMAPAGTDCIAASDNRCASN
ncbi:MAG TPA: nitrous oxide reductase family maturation protein NosD [Gemmatimonadales bacterium]|nr:nitrous oxide reductase family maturation protein NosD [Gemmatimonadales bacterium]